MKLIISGELIEKGIDHIGYSHNDFLFICYDTIRVDLISILKSIGIEWKHMSYSTNSIGHQCREISINMSDNEDIIMVADEDAAPNKIYCFMYNFDIYESAASTMSLHRSKYSAFKAMNKYLNEKWYEEYNNYLMHGKGFDRRDRREGSLLIKDAFKVGQYENWFIEELNIE